MFWTETSGISYKTFDVLGIQRKYFFSEINYKIRIYFRNLEPIYAHSIYNIWGKSENGSHLWLFAASKIQDHIQRNISGSV